MENTYPGFVIKPGSDRAPQIRQLKKQLNALGYGHLDTENSTFGPSTTAAVISFQKAKLLNPDGEVGELTWHRLFNERTPIIEVATTLSGVALEFALTQLYVREKTGHNDGKEVEGYLSSVGLGKGNPYCIAFQYWCCSKAAEKLMVPNPMYKTGHVLTFWNNTPAKFKVTDPQKGDLGIMDFGGGKGHIFRIKKRELINLYTVEGNTSGDPSSLTEDRDGQGVFERLRKTNNHLIKGYIRYE